MTVIAAPDPNFLGSLQDDAERIRRLVDNNTARLKSLRAGNPEDAKAARVIRERLRNVKYEFFGRYAADIYDEVTERCSLPLRLTEVLYAAAGRFPMLLPTRQAIEAERALMQQGVKEGLEIDQGLFLAHLLNDARCGTHLIRSMLMPKQEALNRIDEFRNTGVIDLGVAKAERRGQVGTVTLTNPEFLNAENDVVTAALEIAVDLVLLDKEIQVGVLRGGVVDHPKYRGRRIFSAGINLTHLYYGQISFAGFMMERELGLVNKLYRGHWRSKSCTDDFEDYNEKPWLGVVEAFAIGGGCQLLCVLDRVIAESGSYFNLPASKEGFIPGAAPLRLPRLVGIQNARQGIFFEKKFYADEPEGQMICDEVVPPGAMEAAIEAATTQMMRAGLTSAVGNRKALRVGQEPLDVFRRYMAVFARQQALCMYDPKLMENLEHSWRPDQRRM